MLLLVVVAFVAGAVTALSPCVLPALPVVVAGTATGGRRRLLGVAVGFVATFTVFTLSLAAALRAIGLGPTLLRNIAIALVIVFGLALILPRLDARIAGWLSPIAQAGDRWAQRIERRNGESGLGLALGAALGLVWTPCAGPVFAAIAAIAASGGVGVDAFVVLGAYSIGAIIPLIALGYGGQRLLPRLAPTTAVLRPALGALMVAAGVILFLGVDTRLTEVATRDIPGYTDALQALERTGAVDEELADLRGLDPEARALVEAARGSEPTTEVSDTLDLPDAGPAPELRGISAWFNTPGGEPLTLASLRGRVVLLDFWTYSCVNCLRTLPHLAELYRKYEPLGLTIVGVHTPEFLFEADPRNVRRAIDELDVPYPVALDPEFATWSAYGNRYWPAHYLIDKRGHVRDLYIGEGGYAQTEALVRRALGLPPVDIQAGPSERQGGHSAEVTPESYLGYGRLRRFSSLQQVVRDRPARYGVPLQLGTDGLAYEGEWTVRAQEAVAGEGAAIEIAFRSRDVFLVLDGAGRDREARVVLDGRPPPAQLAGADIGPDGRFTVGTARLYALLQPPEYRTGRLRVELAPGTRAYAFTFGTGTQDQPALGR